MSQQQPFAPTLRNLDGAEIIFQPGAHQLPAERLHAKLKECLERQGIRALTNNERMDRIDAPAIHLILDLSAPVEDPKGWFLTGFLVVKQRVFAPFLPKPDGSPYAIEAVTWQKPGWIQILHPHLEQGCELLIELLTSQLGLDANASRERPITNALENKPTLH